MCDHLIPMSHVLQRAKLLPNPATFSVNEVVFAVTSVDTLFSIKQNEFFKAAKDASALALSSEPEGQSSQGSQTASKDAMARLCRHVLRQRRCVLLRCSRLDDVQV